MFTGEICVRSRSLYHVYENVPKEKKRGVKHYQEKVTLKVNRDMIEYSAKGQVLAQVPGSEKNRRVIQVNAEVDQRNHHKGWKARHKLRHKNATVQVLKAETVKQLQKFHSVNQVNYREKFLEDIIYPWITNVVKPRLLKEIENDEVWLVEDKAASHKTVNNIDAV